MVNLLQHQALGEERFAMVEEGFGVLIHELQAQLALGHLPLVPRPPHPLQNGPLRNSKLSSHELAYLLTCVGVMADTWRGSHSLPSSAVVLAF